MGSANAAVLPDPVWAHPITSLRASTCGMQLACTAVGVMSPSDWHCRTSHGASPAAAHVAGAAGAAPALAMTAGDGAPPAPRAFPAAGGGGGGGRLTVLSSRQVAASGEGS